jgi:hypothetical protein
MATYKFSEFNVEITNPIVNVEKVNDSILYQTCTAEVILTTESAVFGITFSGFTYKGTWDDSDVVNWINNVELPKYLVD